MISLWAEHLPAQSIATDQLRPVSEMRTGVEMTGAARPGAYVSAVGRRAIAMGTERGGFEVWTWPLKLLHNFELEFASPLVSDPLKGSELARRVEITPAGPVITYTHSTFTVRQRVFTPLNEPAVVMLLDVDAIRPLEILAQFVSDLEPAWPAGQGGQYVFWDDSARAFVLSESQRRVNGLVGSPLTTSATNQPAHNVPDAPSQLRITLGGREGGVMPRPGEPLGRLTPIHLRGIPLVIAGGIMPRDSVRAVYRRVLDRIPGLYEERVRHATEVLDHSVRVETPDPSFDLAVRWAALNLDESLVCNPDLGCGVVAGYGPSEARGTRPGFGWFFGGDASINSLGMTAGGQYDLARQGLEFFVRYQRADGKIPHEISQSAGRIRWFEDYPYAFYHADTTPYWIMAWGDYWRVTGDTAAVRRIWPSIKRAYDWCLTTVDSATGLMLNSKGGLGAVEVGDLGVGVRSDIYLSAVWIEALDRIARLADAVEGGARRGSRSRGADAPGRLAAGARSLRAQALATLRDRFWLPDQQAYAFALLEGGAVRPELTIWPSTAMSFGLFDDERGMATATGQARAALVTDWGARALASTSRLFDPLHYNNGTVWPFATGFNALGQYRYRNPVAGFQALRAIARAGQLWGLGRTPEVMSGGQYEPLETAVPQQFFGTSFIPTVLLRGLIGWEPDVPAGTVRFGPQLPAEWGQFRAFDLPAGGARYSLQVERSPGELRGRLRRTSGTTGPDTLLFEPHLPLGSRVAGIRFNSLSPQCDIPRVTRRDVQPSCRVALGDDLEFSITYQGGYEVVLPPWSPERGDRSAGVRLLDQRLEDDSLLLELEGPAGSLGVVLVRRGDQALHPVVRFPEPGDSVDGYSGLTLRSGP